MPLKANLRTGEVLKGDGGPTTFPPQGGAPQRIQFKATPDGSLDLGLWRVGLDHFNREGRYYGELLRSAS